MILHDVILCVQWQHVSKPKGIVYVIVLSCAWVIEIVYWDATASLNPVEMTERTLSNAAAGTTFG